MSFDRNDPRLTAYVLDELDLSERTQIDELLAADEDARDYVEALRETTLLLSNELAGLPVEGSLSDEQHVAIHKAAESPSKRGRTVAWLTGASAVAAAAAMVFAFTRGGAGDDSVSKQSARLAEDRAEANAIRSRDDGVYAKRTLGRPVRNNNHGNAGMTDPAVSPRFARGRTGYRRNVLPRSPRPDVNVPRPSGNRYDHIKHNAFLDTATKPLSTFSIDVDTAAYSTVRSYLARNQRPPKGSVRIEEMINYFSYNYPSPKTKHPFSATTEVSVAPWNRNHRLLRIGLRGKQLNGGKDTPSNLVFLIDVSGSMSSANKLPLLKRSMKMLTSRLKPTDRVAIVVYAGAAGVVLPSTAVRNKELLSGALTRLSAGGSTAGGAGIELAYRIAQKNFVQGGVNRVILATDGDFNVGPSSDAALVSLIKQKAKSNVFLTVLGFGRGNYNDQMLEKLTGHGNGNYAYIDTIGEARKVFVEQLSSTLVTIAKDVKLQIEFNPKHVAKYRLIGYENRMLATKDFKDDKKDAGEIGANHRVTALYELVPAGLNKRATKADRLRYQKRMATTGHGDELLTIKLRYKKPEGDTSTLVAFAVKNKAVELSQTSADFKLAAAVAEFGMLLRDSPHKAQSSYDSALKLATQGAKRDPYGYRAELIGLIKRAKALP